MGAFRTYSRTPISTFRNQKWTYPVFDLDSPVKGEILRTRSALDGRVQIERGWLWPNGRVCHSA
ncbi:hypothetical protein D1224_12175 [Henriciella barbarensis]|uniref:Uncharacterized protein n=1 Tax=Henriciella barbarensis TaxID=86342 RepID=A0A399QVK4_9PROT|nr:hypothetical protein D1224_12175 [Henriciella barbarensis]